MRKSVRTSVVLLALTGTLGVSAFGAEIEPNFAAYLETVDEGDFASAIVYLRDRPNTRVLNNSLRAERVPLAERHSRILGALQRAAGRSQPAFLEYLDQRKIEGSVEGYTPYWIMNLVVVSASSAELEKIALREDVEAVEGNFRATLIEPMDLPCSGNPRTGIGATKSIKAINADRVWRELGFTGDGCLVANMDTGVEGTHPALSARWRGNWHPWQECWRDATGGGTTSPVDSHGHGTHTMGTICGAGHGTGDTVGVAFNAQWIADNSINQGVGPAFDNDVLNGFQWFADPDGNPNTTDDVPDVVECSWGIDSRFGFNYQDCTVRWQEAIENCEASGVVVIFSAGNEGPDPQTHRSPANICTTPTVNFSVGAVDAESYDWPYPIAYFSSRGPSDCDGVSIKPEVTAPGFSIYSSYRDGGYTRISGTSMAGPHVAGVVALMREANPDADVQTIKEILMSTARDLGAPGEDNESGWGVIDAYEAVLAVMGPDTDPPELTVTFPNGDEVLDADSVYTITWDATDNIGVTQTGIYSSSDGGSAWTLIDAVSGNPGLYDWTIPGTPSDQCLVKVGVRDQAGNEDWDVSDDLFTVVEEQSPYVWVEDISLKVYSIGRNRVAWATVSIRDQDDQPVTGAWVLSHWDGLTSDSDIMRTFWSGTVSCTSDEVYLLKGCWDYHVDNVVKSGHVFRTDLGETSDRACMLGATILSSRSADEFVVRHVRRPDVSAEFSLSLPTTAGVSFSIYDVAGRRVRTLVSEILPAGSTTVIWDGTNQNGELVPSGVYFYRVVAGDLVKTSKIVLMR